MGENIYGVDLADSKTRFTPVKEKVEDELKINIKGTFKMLNTTVINLITNTVSEVKLPCKPSKEDILPINYMNEKVFEVIFVTDIVLKEMGIKYSEGNKPDLLVYVK